MIVNRTSLMQLAAEKGWSLPELAKKMDLDYSYLFRVIQGQRNPGRKFFSALMLLCMEEKLSFEDYVEFKHLKK